MSTTSSAPSQLPLALRGIAPDVLATFSRDQIDAIALAAEHGKTRHAVDYRVTLPWIGGPGVYLVVLAGRERRNPNRLESSEAVQRSMLVPSAFAVLAGAGVFGALILLYVAKSLLGLEVSLRDSLLNPLMDIFS